MTYTLAFFATGAGLLAFVLAPGAWRVAAAAVVLTGQAALVALSLGHPLPWWAERGCMRTAVEPAVLVGTADEEAGVVLLWLQAAECGQPRVYEFPYSNATAEALAKAQRAAADNGGGITVKRPFERTYDNQSPLFYAAPQPAPAPKP